MPTSVALVVSIRGREIRAASPAGDDRGCAPRKAAAATGAESFFRMASSWCLSVAYLMSEVALESSAVQTPIVTVCVLAEGVSVSSASMRL